jgi:hypothetical protein
MPEGASGSMQMSAHVFGENHLGLSNVAVAFNEAGTAENFHEMMGKTKNISEMMVFDFITGQSDRHGWNLFVGDVGGWGDEKQAIAHDNGLTFPEHEPDKMGRSVGWGLTMDVMKWIATSDRGSTPINDKMQKAILTFNEDSFKKIATMNGINEKAQAGVLHRVNSIKEHMATKYEDLTSWWKPEDFSTMDEYKGYMKEKMKITPYDIAQIAEKRYNCIIV